VRILIAGAAGVLGRATLPHLRGHDVVGLTRDAAQVAPLEAFGARGAVCDVYDDDALLDVARDARPEAVVNFLTALREGSDANNRIRREGASNLLRAAQASGARRLVVESVAFELREDAAKAVEELERSALAFRGDALVLRFGRLWGPGTFHATEPEAPAVHLAVAGAEAARLVVEGRPGVHIVA
jgi:nucleoside-diphosphate-sugar epimerase